VTRPKHLRPRYRYLAVEIDAWPDAALDRDAFQAAVWDAARGLLGDAESAAVGGRVVAFAAAGGTAEAVVRAHRGTVGRARATLACIDAGDGDPVGVRVRGTSGTIRACEERHLGRASEGVGTSTVEFDEAERTAVDRGDAIDVRVGDGYVGATDRD
jgi:ribonuclease P/MRP protein subunit POP5